MHGEPPKHRRDDPETPMATIIIVAVGLGLAAVVVGIGIIVSVGLSN